jgi:D-3-phosphoglycerate dehydrogenase / 2-oxoglutarate reductase
LKVLISDAMSKTVEDILLKSGGIEVDVKTGLSEDELVGIIADYEGLIVRSATKVTKKIIDAASQLKAIGRAGAGVDNIDVEYAKSKGMIVMNTPGANSHAVAELAIGYLFVLARRIHVADKTMKAGKWEKKKLMGTEIKDKTLGVLGLGKIGMDVALLGKALGMNVIGYDPILTEEQIEGKGIKLVSIDDVITESDYITLHIPANDKTKNLFNKETFAKMKDGVKIINCARGGIVNEADLVDAVNSGKVSGAAMDVYGAEPVSTDSPLLNCQEIVLSPHIGASTKEAQENVGIMIANQIADFLKTGNAIHTV